jgi:hypothetical protein
MLPKLKLNVTRECRYKVQSQIFYFEYIKQGQYLCYPRLLGQRNSKIYKYIFIGKMAKELRQAEIQYLSHTFFVDDNAVSVHKIVLKKFQPSLVKNVNKMIIKKCNVEA